MSHVWLIGYLGSSGCADDPVLSDSVKHDSSGSPMNLPVSCLPMTGHD